LFVRHAKDIKISDVEFSFLESDYRPCMIFDDADGVDLRNISVQRPDKSRAIVLKDVNNFSVLQSKGIQDLKLETVIYIELK